MCIQAARSGSTSMLEYAVAEGCHEVGDTIKIYAHAIRKGQAHVVPSINQCAGPLLGDNVRPCWAPCTLRTKACCEVGVVRRTHATVLICSCIKDSGNMCRIHSPRKTLTTIFATFYFTLLSRTRHPSHTVTRNVFTGSRSRASQRCTGTSCMYSAYSAYSAYLR